MNARFSARTWRALTLLLAVWLLSSPLLPVHAQTRPRSKSTTRRRAASTPPARTTTHAPGSKAASPAPKTATPTILPPAHARPTVPPHNAPVTPRAPDGETSDGTTFETLLAADSYVVYGEMRNVGQQMRPGGFFSMLEQIWHTSMGSNSKEITKVLDFYRLHAEELAHVRTMFAAMPVAPGMPQWLTAFELPSVAAAQKFTPELRAYMNSVMPARNAATSANTAQGPATAPSPTAKTTPAQTKNVVAKTAAPAFYVERSNRLVIASETQFTFKDLRREADQLLAHQPNFKTARRRFASEAMFLYVDLNLMNRAAQRMMETMKTPPEVATITSEGAGSMPPQTGVAAPAHTDPMPFPPDTRQISFGQRPAENVVEPVPIDPVHTSPSPDPQGLSSAQPSSGEMTARKSTTEAEGVLIAEPSITESSPASIDLASVMMPFLFGMHGGIDTTLIPEAVGVGIALEGDALAARALLLHSAPTRPMHVVPFLRFLIPGPALTPEAATVMPAETGIYINASLDLTKIYDLMTNSFQSSPGRILTAEEAAAHEGGMMVGPVAGPSTSPSPGADESNKEAAPNAQIAALEKLLNFKVKEDLIGSLGNEIAVSIPSEWMNPTPTRPRATRSATEGISARPPVRAVGPVGFIALRNRDALQSLLPRLLNALSLTGGGANLKEKVGDVEIMNFGSVSLAFTGNYLAVAPDVASLRHVLNATQNGQTLALQPDFRHAMSWQPRPSLGQVYVSNNLLKSIFSDMKKSEEQFADDESQKFLASFTLDPGAITHVVTDEGDGPLHELRLPGDLLKMFSGYRSVAHKHAPMRGNEQTAMGVLHTLYSMQETYKETAGHGNYATLAELSREEGFPTWFFNGPSQFNYAIEMTATGNKFEISATPTAYPDQGRRSFFIDESGVLKGADKGGQRATATDETISSRP